MVSKNSLVASLSFNNPLMTGHLIEILSYQYFWCISMEWCSIVQLNFFEYVGVLTPTWVVVFGGGVQRCTF
jgi:hypothetical protein